jgi:DNA (cytosine-5)-methyltransferase 1
VRALDLFCSAGGAARGLADAGYEVHGVDIEPQPNYPYAFSQFDALDASAEWIASFDLVWASPPCQAFTAYKRRPGHVRPALNLIFETRDLLKRHARAWIIENVHGAPLQRPTMLCGSMFGLDVRRHRYFETSFPVLAPTCRHHVWKPRFPPATNRTNLRRTVEVGVWRIPLATQQAAMGIDWMTLEELSQAIPPAYSRFLAEQAIASRRAA